MIEGFQPLDYAFCGLAVVAAVTGLFRGFSGTLGFAVGAIAAFFAATLGWPFSATLTDVTWMRAVGVLVGTLLAFGLVRLFVKKTVSGLLAQPSDALIGALLGAILSALVPIALARFGMGNDYSLIVRELSAYV